MRPLSVHLLAWLVVLALAAPGWVVYTRKQWMGGPPGYDTALWTPQLREADRMQPRYATRPPAEGRIRVDPSVTLTIEPAILAGCRSLGFGLEVLRPIDSQSRALRFRIGTPAYEVTFFPEEELRPGIEARVPFGYPPPSSWLRERGPMRPLDGSTFLISWDGARLWLQSDRGRYECSTPRSWALDQLQFQVTSGAVEVTRAWLNARCVRAGPPFGRPPSVEDGGTAPVPRSPDAAAGRAGSPPAARGSGPPSSDSPGARPILKLGPTAPDPARSAGSPPAARGSGPPSSDSPGARPILKLGPTAPDPARSAGSPGYTHTVRFDNLRCQPGDLLRPVTVGTVLAAWLLFLFLTELLWPAYRSGGDPAPARRLDLEAARLRFALLGAAAAHVPPLWYPDAALAPVALWLLAHRRSFVPATDKKRESAALSAVWLGLGVAAFSAVWALPYLDTESLNLAGVLSAAAGAALLAATLGRAWPLALIAALPLLTTSTICWLKTDGHLLRWPSTGLLQACGWTAICTLVIALLVREWIASSTPIVAGLVLVIAAHADAAIKLSNHPCALLGDAVFYEMAVRPGALPIVDRLAYFTMFRGREPAREKGDRFRIVVMGGSVAYGWGLEPGSSQDYSARLQELLAVAPTGRAVEVINAAVPSFTAEQGLELLRTRLLALSPDLVLLTFGTNDQASDAPGPGRDRQFMQNERRVAASPFLAGLRRTARRSGLYLLLVSKLRPVVAPESSVEGPPRVTRAEFVEDLEAFVRLSREHGFRLALTGDVFAQDFGRVGPLEYWGAPAMVPAREVAERHSIPFLDGAAGFRNTHIPPAALFYDHVHLTPTGHDLMARGLASEIRRAGLLK